MDPITLGIIVAIALIALMAIGTPIAFALGGVSLLALIYDRGLAELTYFGETFFDRIAEFGFVAIPMFILMGAAVASSPTGRDLYRSLDLWMGKLPGGLAVSNIGACSIFAALSGSSPATCAAIGKMGIPEMRMRGYPDGVAAGCIAAGGTLGILIPPSVTMIIYGISTETSIGRLFIAGVVPGFMLAGLFMIWTMIACKMAGGYNNPMAESVERLKQNVKQNVDTNLKALVRVLPFLGVVAGILFALYGGVATPSEAAGVGAFLCLALAILIYRMWQLGPIKLIMRDSLRESVMIMLVIATAEVFAYALSSMFITQTVAAAIADLEINRWALMGVINLFLLVAGFFLPPVAVIVMTAPILLPIILAANFDPYWFAVILTINLEIGLITPPVGLNLFIIKGIAPDISLRDILMGSLPYALCMVLGILLLCLFPGIALWLPNLIMG
ncbi:MULTISPECIES: TRAP transporter large permease [Halomonadaceae]|jgi:C4-dicarboxylate transporter, DctM subunit|uniref:TRAP transporter large permease protein n=2 Tax=Vreelandella titanicae TaxID=664683 RepID=L9UCH5_9GAMM|nr:MULTISPECIES: TRAP transporter large permease [Halomonas]NAO94467.1 TRAP transporter large permease subunit [Halomonas sp. MG34]UEQ03438.1 TRAP transporter large permease [Halomonas profundus]ELY22412.1 TRAP dicarboxylate transporter, DctM subunit [Halomonas titanicae BH1]MCD1584903.1 TRAP transporter large permease [Halomonas sp. IOP_14]NVE88528.1 TRAP transporter large permease [Halomonas titanicae]|tara:strand:- start:432 stop:1766 length:1335 start_codon:yes stop_codon:yes gene_type:complete